MRAPAARTEPLDTSQHYERFWGAVSGADADAGRAQISELLDEGIPGAELISLLLSPAQRDVGRRWERGELTVADEHAATAVVDAALSVVEGSYLPVSDDAPLAVVVCAETEWHVLPARLAAQVLRGSGTRVRFLGPSMPADHLREYLARLEPDLLLVSATMPTSLAGAARSIAAGRDLGIPVLAGGIAFGLDDRRARTLQADAWAFDPRVAIVPRTPPQGDGPRWSLFNDLQGSAAAAMEAAYDQLFDRIPQMRRMSSAGLHNTRKDLAYILDFLAAALLVDDPRLMRHFTEWLCGVLEVRGVPRSAVTASYDALGEQVRGPAQALLMTESRELIGA